MHIIFLSTIAPHSIWYTELMLAYVWNVQNMCTEIDHLQKNHVSRMVCTKLGLYWSKPYDKQSFSAFVNPASIDYWCVLATINDFNDLCVWAVWYHLNLCHVQPTQMYGRIETHVHMHSVYKCIALCLFCVQILMQILMLNRMTCHTLLLVSSNWYCTIYYVMLVLQ